MAPVRSTRIPVLVGGIAFLVSLLVLGAVSAVAVRVGDSLARDVEMSRLVRQIEASEQAMTAVQQEEARILAQYQAGDLPAERMREQLAAVARAGATTIEAAGQRVAEVPWLRWHSQVRSAQQAYLAHNRAWVDYLERAAEDPSEFGRPQAEVNDTFEQVRDPLLAAVPSWDPLEVRDRAAAVLAPAAESSTPGQQA